MVFEVLFKPRDIETKPWEMLAYTLLVTWISFIFAYTVFHEYASIITIFLITIAIFPVIHKVLEDQEEIEELEAKQLSFMERYKKIIEIYFFFFLGITLATSIGYYFMDNSITYELFKEQIKTIENIRNENLTGYATHPYQTFFDIVTNNIKVAFIAFIMSFFFGTGASFLIAWNSSVIGVFIGYYTTEFAKTGIHPFAAYFSTFLSISLHGIPEMIGYFLAGIAGGILSFGIIKGSIFILKDSLNVFLISIGVILLAGVIEVLPYIIG